MKNNNFLNETVSMQEVVHKPVTHQIELIQWLNETISPTHQITKQAVQMVNDIRACTDKSNKRDLKRKLPGITPGCLLQIGQQRLEKNIVSRTGWMQIDIDHSDNPSINDSAMLRQAVANIVYVAYSGLSVSGKGVWALIKVQNPEKLDQHFTQLQYDFASRGIVIDPSKGSNPHDFRFYSFDPEAIIKKEYKLYDRLPIASPLKSSIIQNSEVNSSDRDIFQEAARHTRNKGYTFTYKKDMHNSIFQLCCFLNWSGVAREKTEDWISKNLISLSEINSNCISYPYEIYHNDFGIRFSGNRHDLPKKVISTPAVNIPKQKKHTHQKINPYTGEIIDQRGYPASWDEVELLSQVKTENQNNIF